MDCLDDNMVSAYLARRLSSTEQQQVVDHLSSCDLCLTITCASTLAEPPARRSLRVPMLAAAVLAIPVTVVLAWPARHEPARVPAPIAAITTSLEQERLALLTREALAAHRYAAALELARATGDRRALVLAELGSEQLADVIRDASALVAQTTAPPADAVKALVAAHALLGHHELARGVLDRLDGAEHARAATDLAIYEGRLDDALATADPLEREMIRVRRADRPDLAANLVLEARWPEAGGESWLAHERRARAALDALERERELRWCLDHRGQAALFSLALLPDVERALR